MSTPLKAFCRACRSEITVVELREPCSNPTLPTHGRYLSQAVHAPLGAISVCPVHGTHFALA